ncbi:MAG: GNAT family N-acetyltransferase [Marmoricola sp.]|jgi:GNAT superfamily N-acetyltransferase
MSTADQSVRIGWAEDAPALARVQVAAWQELYAEVLPAQVLAGLVADDLTPHWLEALTRAKDARQRVLVALERATVVGYTLTMPATDPDCDPIADAEIAEVVVAPDRVGQGHGSRLMHAAIDTLRADKFSRATHWINATDDASRAFFTEAGWAPDGAFRELDLTGDGTTIVKQVRLHTTIAG